VSDAEARLGDLCRLLGLDARRVADLVASLTRKRVTVAAAESLTAGLFTAALTEIPGSSSVLRGGIVCYATDLKASLVGVDADLLDRVGPVDPDVAIQLAAGARSVCGADLGIGLTGVAGPGPQDGVPAGTVFVAAAAADRHQVSALPGQATPTDRWQVRAAAVRTAIDLLEELSGDPVPGEPPQR
jgi:nicotinamide-nucleotide amidase